MDTKISTALKVDLERMLLDGSAEPTHLPLSLLEHITNNFSDDQQIGIGGFAVVYKGIVGKGTVAVKKLSQTPNVHESKFHKEVECMMKAKHKNIVRFLGYCSDAQGRVFDHEGKFVMADLRNWLLCFEYVPNGSLDMYITDASSGLEWRERYQIIKGICEGLLHLHEKRIIHLDLKPGNILVDDHMVPKIADFGLSRCLDKDQTRDFTSHLCGSQGYLAPEFYRGQVAFASDIYSLGVIIVEILTGEKGYPEDANVIENWMNQLEGSDQWEIQLEQVRVCTKIGIECMDLDPKKRPHASHIINRLDKTSSTIKTGISSSPVEQHVSYLEDQYFQGEVARLSPEYFGKDIKEHAETKELVEYVQTPREDHWQKGHAEAPFDKFPVWGVQNTKQNVSLQAASIFCSSLDIFNAKARRNYMRNGGPTLEKIKYVKLFKLWEVKPFLKDHNFVGKGCFGEVYKGFVDNAPIVVRKLISGRVLENGKFVNEVIIQSQVFHKNIVRLIGCCLEVDIPMLVYEYVSKGSLDDILHSNNKVPLDLGVRLSIAAASAGALAYMHSMTSTKILHGDVKPANILLDHDFVPKISDFGLSWVSRRDCEQTKIDTGAYMDPVYLQTGRLTEQSDIFSFGVIILELISRKKAKDCVREFLENHRQGRKLTELFDKEIAVTGNLDLLDNLAEMAVECLNNDMDLRPTMVDVAKRLSILKYSHELALLQAS